MAKVSDIDVPPELVALYTRLISNGKAGATSSNSSRIRTAATRPTKKRKAPYVTRRLSAMVDLLCKRLGLTEDTQEWRSRHYLELSNLLDGVIDPDLWLECVVLSVTSLESFPENVPDPSPPPYAYRDVGNLPSLTTYLDGEETVGHPTYEGAHSGGYFNDNYWRWTRKVFALQEPVTDPLKTAAFYYGSLSFEIDADARASKPMFSALAHPIYARSGDGILETVDPPRVKAISFYWRYTIPDSDAPFFHKEYQRRIMMLPRLTPKFTTGLPADRAVMTIGPRPMLGRGFNNNQSVSVQMQEDIKLYQLHPCAGQLPRPILRDPSGKLALYSPLTGELVSTSFDAGYTYAAQTRLDLVLLSPGTPAKIYTAALSAVAEWAPVEPFDYPLSILRSCAQEIFTSDGVTVRGVSSSGSTLHSQVWNPNYGQMWPRAALHPLWAWDLYCQFLSGQLFFFNSEVSIKSMSALPPSGDKICTTSTGVWWIANLAGSLTLYHATPDSSAPTLLRTGLHSRTFMSRWRDGGIVLFSTSNSTLYTVELIGDDHAPFDCGTLSGDIYGINSCSLCAS
jgi:hypothetical protein